MSQNDLKTEYMFKYSIFHTPNSLLARNLHYSHVDLSASTRSTPLRPHHAPCKDCAACAVVKVVIRGECSLPTVLSRIQKQAAQQALARVIPPPPSIPAHALLTPTHGAVQTR